MLNITKIFKFILNCIHFSGFPKHSFQSLRCFIHVSVSLSLACWCHPTDRPTDWIFNTNSICGVCKDEPMHTRVSFSDVTLWVWKRMWMKVCEYQRIFLVIRAIIQGVSFCTPPMLISNSIYLIGENTSKWLLLLPLGDGYDLCESA